MLKEACATAALVAATLVPSTSQVQAGTADCVRAAAGVAESRAAPCKWMTSDSGRKCLYCKGKRGGWKRQYCEKKETKPKLRECDTAPDPANPKKVCTICKEDGTVVSRDCKTTP
ncbi:hypothetical protein AB0K18_00840 [Nonomuraea sp. NPDC049421]|uniref:hypothetical protein n=1 Tax=Nonomuraea sp. NPDC049421 TaxID=3155275 RepID=UPI0034400D6F